MYQKGDWVPISPKFLHHERTLISYLRLNKKYNHRKPHNNAKFWHLLILLISVRDTNDFLTDKLYEHMVIKGRCKAIFALYLPFIFHLTKKYFALRCYFGAHIQIEINADNGKKMENFSG